MDREKYGKIIVDQIINDYKNSKEFRDDARQFIYRWLDIIINYKTAGLGDKFVQQVSTQDSEPQYVLPEDAQKLFMEGMDKYNNLRTKMNELDAMLGDEANSNMYPHFFNN